jgi:hypothetical protein
MSKNARSSLLLLSILFALNLAGCAHEVGSPAWCADMREKPKGDWSANEATDYMRYCIFK